MHDDIVRNMTKTIVDGIKDAQMQYEYACDARKAGEPATAKLHIDEAAKRLDGVMAWWHKAQEMGAVKEKESTVADALMWHYKDWYRTLKAKIAEFKV